MGVTNSGDIEAHAYGATAVYRYHVYRPKAEGIYAVATSGDSTVSNSGSITAASNGIAYGIIAESRRGGLFYVDNSGSVTATGGLAIGIESYGGFGNTGLSQFTNSGDITASAGFLSYGVFAAVGSGYLTVDNSGTVNANAGVDSHAPYNATATGLRLYSVSGAIDASNSGAISATAQSAYYQAVASGIAVENLQGTAITVSNSSTGSITADASTLSYSTARATGIEAYNSFSGAVDVANAGVVSATARSGAASNIGFFGETTATGIGVTNMFGTSATVSNSSTGAITASATTDAYGAAGATGITAYSSYGTVEVTNAGAITATAMAANHPDAGGVASATGITAIGAYGATSTVSNASTGNVSATATGDAGAYAIGLMASGATVTAYSDGSIDATATASATQGTALASGMVVSGGDTAVSLGSSSHLAATASGYAGNAIGLAISSDNAVTASNAGAISATFTGTQGAAYGVLIASGGDVSFTNSGDITATQSNYATGVELSSPGHTTLINNGIITTNTAIAGNLAVLMGDSSNLIQNTGVINGSIVTGSGGDTLTNSTGAVWNTGLASNFGAGNNAVTNAGTITGAIQFGAGNDTFANLAGALWNAAGGSSFGDGNNTVSNAGTITGALQFGSGDNSFTNAAAGLWNLSGVSIFGAGSNSLTNAGTMYLDAATIDLGSSATSTLSNTGLITLVGNNAIDLGAGTFTNNGTLAFTSGSTNDVLTIMGNFAGHGILNVNTSGLQNASDMLHIQGNVAAGTMNTINVHLLDDPLSASSMIPVVTVSGDSAPSSFVLGTVTQSNSFLALTYGDTLLSRNDTSNSANNVFSLDVAVTGLSDLGSLAASIAPGAQSLMNSQIGTLQERMGALDPARIGALGVWARVFNDSGEVSPQHAAGNFGQSGSFAFNENNSGSEVGLDVAVSDQVRAGVMFDKAEADDVNTGGQSQLNGHTSGIYGTWLAPDGFYLDASYRWMHFGAKLISAAGMAWANGAADGFNLESGKTWILHGDLMITPQLQYTWIQVNHIDSVAGAVAGFQSSGDTSSRGRLGVMISRSFTLSGMGRTLWTPYASISAVREFDGTSHYAVNSNFFGQTSTRGTSMLAEAGLDIQAAGLSVYGGVNWQDGGPLKNVLGGQLGLRYQW
ncbi:MAG: autotransporter outer membrane beta-barrel domain-containing protein [Acidimicrobiales bacterium]